MLLTRTWGLVSTNPPAEPAHTRQNPTARSAFASAIHARVAAPARSRALTPAGTPPCAQKEKNVEPLARPGGGLRTAAPPLIMARLPSTFCGLFYSPFCRRRHCRPARAGRSKTPRRRCWRRPKARSTRLLVSHAPGSVSAGVVAGGGWAPQLRCSGSKRVRAAVVEGDAGRPRSRVQTTPSPGRGLVCTARSAWPWGTRT